MAVTYVNADSTVPPHINILSIPNEITVRILSYVLNFMGKSYVSCLFSCKSWYVIAKNDPILPKKVTLFRMKFFCDLNYGVKIMRPDHYGRETSDFESYDKLLGEIHDLIRLIALREARGVEGKNIAKTTLYVIQHHAILKKGLEEIERLEEVRKPDTRQKVDEEAENDKIAVELVRQVSKGKLSADEKSLFTAIWKFTIRGYREEKIFIATLEKLAPLDLPKAEAIVATMEQSRLSHCCEAAQVAILKVKALTDPSTAFQLACNLGESPAFLDVFKVILSQKFETAETLTIALDSENKHRNKALYQLIKVLISKDIDKAWRYMQLITDGLLQRKAINRILTFAYQHNFPQYQNIIANIVREEPTISSITLEISIQLEVQKDITAAKKAAENIQDPITKGKAWLAILTFLATQQVSIKDIHEAISHLPAEEAVTMMGPLAKSNFDLALSLTLQTPPSVDRDDQLMHILYTTKEKNFANAIEVAMHMGARERDKHLLYLSNYAGIENLDFMKSVAKIMLSSRFRINHFDALQSICNSIAYWLDKYSV